MADLVPSGMIGSDGLHLEQANGDWPKMVTSGGAAGESGVSIFRASFEGGAHFRTTPLHHIICFKVSPRGPVNCRIAGRSLWHDAPQGSLAVLPAGEECAADAEQSMEAIFVAIDPSRLALAATEDMCLGPRVIERLTGQDRDLFQMALLLESECAQGYPEGALYWNDVAGSVIRAVVRRHSTSSVAEIHARLSRDAIGKINDYVQSHLDRPIDVSALASIVALSPFHFSRLFAKAAGVTPHRYVVHLRLRRAIELIREGRCTLAEIAARTGFADQSHLTRWVRRVHGVTPREIAS